MSEHEVDNYLAGLDEAKRTTFKVRGNAVAGFAAFKNHLSYLPHSGSVLSEIPDDVAPYATSKGALQFAVDSPLPKALVKKLITVRMHQLPDL